MMEKVHNGIDDTMKIFLIRLIFEMREVFSKLLPFDLFAFPPTFPHFLRPFFIFIFYFYFFIFSFWPIFPHRTTPGSVVSL